MNALNCSAVLEGLGRLSIQAGVMVLLVLLTQGLFRRQLTPRWRCSLWLLVVLRLCLPVSLSSVVSVFNLLPRLSANIESQSQSSFLPTASYALGSPAKPSLADARVMDDLVAQSPNLPRAEKVDPKTLVQPMIPPPVLASESFPSTEVSAIKPLIMSWPFILLAAWLAGLFSLAGYVTVTSLRLARHLAKADRVTDPSVLELLDACREQMRVRTCLTLAESPFVRSPALYGLRHPRLLLPSGFTQQFPQNELRFVFLHELAHLKRWDLLMNWIVTVLQLVYWFNPLVWFGFTRWRADRELACDALVLETAGSEQNKAYGRTILHLLETVTTPVTAPGLVGILEDKRQLRKRMSLIARFQPCRRWGFASLLLLAALGLVGLTDAQTSKVKDEKAGTPEKTTTTSAIESNLIREIRHGADPLITNNDTNTIIHSLAVIVKDAATAKPVPNAEVFIVNDNQAEPQPRRMTDQDGQFILRISLLPKENRASIVRLKLAAQHPQYATRFIVLEALKEDLYDVLTEKVTITMEPGITIGGRVQDERGSPLADIRILLSGSHVSPVGMRPGEQFEYEGPFIRLTDKTNPAAITDKNGLWTFAHFPSNLRNLDITLVWPDESLQSFVIRDYLSAFGLQKPVMVFDTLRDQTAVFTLKDGITVRGLVVDEKGRPLSGVLVKEAYGPNTAIRVSEFKTDANGRFEVRNRMPRQWIYTASSLNRATVSAVVQVKPGMPEVRLVMPPAKPLRIEVTDEKNKPVEGVRIRPYPAQDEGQILDWEGQTDAQGTVIWTNAPNAPVILLATKNARGSNRIYFGAAAGNSVAHLAFSQNGLQLTPFQFKALDAQSQQPVIIDQVSALEFRTSSQSTFSLLAQPGTNEFKLNLQQRADPLSAIHPRPMLLKFEANGYQPYILNCPKWEESDRDLALTLLPGTLIKCTVLTPDNRPAGGATVWARPYEDGLGVFSYSPGQYAGGNWFEFQADENGKFNMPLVTDEQPVVITHDQGFLQTTVAELKRKPIVQLQAFGRIEGRLIVNGQSKEGVTIMLSDLEFNKKAHVASSAYQLPAFHLSFGTQSLTNGWFSFSKVPPGEYLISRRYTQRSGRNESSHQMPVIVKPGETLKIEYGERGRQILGRAVVDPVGIAVDWFNGTHLLVLKQTTVPRLIDEDYVSSKARDAARDALLKSPALSEQLRKARNYELIFNADGTFQVDDVPPGTYELKISGTKPRAPYELSPYNSPEVVLGVLVREVVVPPGDQPFNLGAVVVQMRNNSL